MAPIPAAVVVNAAIATVPPRALQVLDISMNNIEGRLPGCLVNGLSELYVTGNALGGPLPPFKPSNQLVTLYANQQRGLGFTGKWGVVAAG